MSIDATVVASRSEGVVLGPITVRVDDTARAGEDALSLESGLFLKTELGLEVFLIYRCARFLLVSPAGLRMWDTTPARIAELTEAVSLYFEEDGSSYTLLYRGGVSLDSCGTMAQYAAVRGAEDAK